MQNWMNKTQIFALSDLKLTDFTESESDSICGHLLRNCEIELQKMLTKYLYKFNTVTNHSNASSSSVVANQEVANGSP